MKAKSNIIASAKTPKAKFYVRIVDGGYSVMRDTHTNCIETDLTAAIAKMLRMAYFETKQTVLCGYVRIATKR